jgi:hypothetical protein
MSRSPAACDESDLTIKKGGNKMKNIRAYLAAACAVVFFAGAFLLNGVSASNAAATNAKTDVIVVNTTDSPIPVVAQGTTNIAGSVSVAGNSPSNPLSVRDVDNLARPPYQATIIFGGGGDNCHAFPTVPTGKLLVIDYVSASITGAQSVIATYIETQANGSDVSYDLFLRSGNPRLDAAPSVVSQQIQAFAEGNYSFCVSWVDFPPTSARATVSGHLVDMP